MVTKGAYGQLKERWRLVLRKKTKVTKNMSAQKHPHVWSVLHNGCLMQRDSIPIEFDLKVGPDGNEKRN